MGKVSFAADELSPGVWQPFIEIQIEGITVTFKSDMCTKTAEDAGTMMSEVFRILTEVERKNLIRYETKSLS